MFYSEAIVPPSLIAPLHLIANILIQQSYFPYGTMGQNEGEFYPYAHARAYTYGIHTFIFPLSQKNKKIKKLESYILYRPGRSGMVGR